MISPTLQLNLAKTLQAPPFVSMARPTIASLFDKNNVLKYAAANGFRFDYGVPAAECLGLKINAGYTNLALNSEVFTVGSAVTITSNAAVAPDGATTMDLLVENTANTEHFANDTSTTPTVGKTYCYSIYVRDTAGANRSLYHRVAGGNVALIRFNPVNKTLSGNSGANYVSSNFEDLGNGIFRVWVVYTATSASSTVHRPQLYNRAAASSVYTGDSASGLYVWGRQLVEGAEPLPYIPTAASSVAVSADVCSISGSDFSNFFRPDEGAFILEGDFATDATTSYFPLCLSDGTFNNSIYISSTNGVLSLGGVSGGTTQFDINLGAYVANAKTKIAFSYKANAVSASKDGGTIITDTSATLPTVDRLDIGSAIGSGFIKGHIGRITYYSAALPTYLQEFSR